ncbi:hypothetical protein L204_102978 [Cryptococcus depauperatus]|nr:hypothetical protein L204_00277 [Cryptococcus depauperatus CBS 7855]
MKKRIYLKRHYGTAIQSKPDIAVLLRKVMRNVAQPVAIAVATTPPSSSPTPVAKYHGATLTSFTSLTLHPRPLVAFSLRLPSRMADCLRPWGISKKQDENAVSGFKKESSGLQLPPKSELPWPLCQLPMPEHPPPWAQALISKIPNPLSSTFATAPASLPTASPATSMPPSPLTISLLSTANESIADALAQPQTDHSSIFAMPHTWDDPTPSQPSHPPSLKGCIGSLQCQVVGSVLLRDLRLPEDIQEGEGSEMFICRVVGVDTGSGTEPLLHWRRKYAGVRQMD